MTASRRSSSSSSSSSTTPHTKNVFRLHGVNVLNRKNVDSIARLTALERRRATHILDERQRRDTMNQLLTELSSLVRESVTELENSPQQQQPPSQCQQQQQQQQPQPQQQQPPSSSNQVGLSTVSGGRPPVKSNSITTLRNAIAEIRRLRACAGLQQIHTLSSSPSSSEGLPTQPSSRSTSPSPSELASLSTLAELASQHAAHGGSMSMSDGSIHSDGSCDSSPMSSPKSSSFRALSPTTSEVYPATSTEIPSSQLYSPPLSPSSPNTQTNFAMALPHISTTGYSNVNGQPQVLPSLHAIVQPYQQLLQQQQHDDQQSSALL